VTAQLPKLLAAPGFFVPIEISNQRLSAVPATLEAET
jgi:hypothetical protein